MRLSRRSFTATLAAGALGGLATPASLRAADGRHGPASSSWAAVSAARPARGILRRANPGLDITLVEKQPRDTSPVR